MYFFVIKWIKFYFELLTEKRNEHNEKRNDATKITINKY